MKRLENKRALITGGTTGIGLATAKRFLTEGARVAITGQNPETLAAARDELGAGVLVIQCDASNAVGQRALAEQIAQHFGKLDVLFVNAGVVDMRPFDAFDPEGFDRSFAINVKGPYFLIQSLVQVFARPASIILNGSVNAHIGMANTSVYAATKAALVSLGRTLSGELIGRGVRVNTVSPGPVETPLYGKLGMTGEQLKSVATAIQNQVPAGRFGKAEEIAAAVAFFASDESAFTVGAELLIDGGMSEL